MIPIKRKLEEFHDPDYPIEFPIKRNKCNIDKQQQKQLTIMERHEKIKSIIHKQFQMELTRKEEELNIIENKLITCKRLLRHVRYAVVSEYYTKKNLLYSNSEINQELTLVNDNSNSSNNNVTIGDNKTNQSSTPPPITTATTTSSSTSSSSTSAANPFEQHQIHPSLKKLLGKSTVDYDEILKIRPIRKAAKTAQSSIKERFTKKDDRKNKTINNSDNNGTLKIPRYIAPLEVERDIPKLNSARGRNKIKQLLIVGNSSKYIGDEKCDNGGITHKWLVYVITKEGYSIEQIVTKVQFTLHPSYKPNDVIDIRTPPFQLSRRGWGEFPIRVKLYFHPHIEQKPIQIIHNLILDKKLTGFQTMGAETLVQMWLKSMHTSSNIKNKKDPICNNYNNNNNNNQNNYNNNNNNNIQNNNNNENATNNNDTKANSVIVRNEINNKCSSKNPNDNINNYNSNNGLTTTNDLTLSNKFKQLTNNEGIKIESIKNDKINNTQSDLNTTSIHVDGLLNNNNNDNNSNYINNIKIDNNYNNISNNIINNGNNNNTVNTFEHKIEIKEESIEYEPSLVQLQTQQLIPSKNNVIAATSATTNNINDTAIENLKNITIKNEHNNNQSNEKFIKYIDKDGKTVTAKLILNAKSKVIAKPVTTTTTTTTLFNETLNNIKTENLVINPLTYSTTMTATTSIESTAPSIPISNTVPIIDTSIPLQTINNIKNESKKSTMILTDKTISENLEKINLNNLSNQNQLFIKLQTTPNIMKLNTNILTTTTTTTATITTTTTATKATPTYNNITNNNIKIGNTNTILINNKKVQLITLKKLPLKNNQLLLSKNISKLVTPSTATTLSTITHTAPGTEIATGTTTCATIPSSQSLSIQQNQLISKQLSNSITTTTTVSHNTLKTVSSIIKMTPEITTTMATSKCMPSTTITTSSSTTFKPPSFLPLTSFASTLSTSTAASTSLSAVSSFTSHQPKLVKLQANAAPSTFKPISINNRNVIIKDGQIILIDPNKLQNRLKNNQSIIKQLQSQSQQQPVVKQISLLKSKNKLSSIIPNVIATSTFITTPTPPTTPPVPPILATTALDYQREFLPNYPILPQSKVILSTNQKNLLRNQQQNLRKMYRQELENNFYDSHTFINIRKAVEFLLNEIPLINELVKLDNDYQTTFPFIVDSIETYENLSVPKQRCYEWLRAKMINDMLKKHKYFRLNPEKIWTTKEIIVFARKFAYSPPYKLADCNSYNNNINTISNKKLNENNKLAKLIKNEIKREKEANQNTIIINEKIINCLNCMNKKIQNNIEFGVTNENNNTKSIVEIIDVETIPETKPNKKSSLMYRNELNNCSYYNNNNQLMNDNKYKLLPIDNNLEVESNWIRDLCKTLQINLQTEEIIPGVMHSSAERILIQCLRSFTEKLIRKSYSEMQHNNFSNTNNTRMGNILQFDDIRNTIVKTTKFDFITNKYLGIDNFNDKKT